MYTEEENLAFFLNLLGTMELEVYNRGEAIITYGEIGSKFFVLLSGSINIYTPRPQEDIRNDL